jgi:hypothetical protein
MNTHSLDDFVAVPFSTELYMAVASRHPGAVSTVIEQVVWDYLDRTDEEGLFKQTLATTQGLHWGTVFLPSGTQLRVKHYKEYKYAEVTGDEIDYNGKSLSSASQMASLMCNNTSVNAWMLVEVNRPTDKGWWFANALRRKA